ncbi:MAG: hypothetical protein Q8866_02510, partial [Candidatus Phytoplasma australasiaticum]|nr:hypothetical protein [Candidatus Phytoplasma australasiaticum]
IQQNKKLAAGRPIVLGITRSSLKSDSLLSAASFQETTKILIDGPTIPKHMKLRPHNLIHIYIPNFKPTPFKLRIHLNKQTLMVFFQFNTHQYPYNL